MSIWEAVDERPLPHDPAAVDEGAVAAAEVLDEKPLLLAEQSRVVPAHRGIGDDEVARGVATEDRPLFEQRDPVPFPGTGRELEPAR
jgi:hypothetical protein